MKRDNVPLHSAIENSNVAGVDVTNAIAPWGPAPEMGAGASGASFPDARSYLDVYERAGLLDWREKSR